MEWTQLLHGPFKEATGYFKLFLDTLKDELETLRQASEDYAEEYAITTATLLDKWGVDLDLPRKTGEDNTSYRARLLDVYDGKGIVKGDLEDMVDGLLNAAGYGDCTIHEWFDDLVYDLDLYEFRIELPLEVKIGFFDKMAYCNFLSTTARSFKESWATSTENVLDEMGIDEIDRLLTKYKAAGTHYRITYGGETV